MNIMRLSGNLVDIFQKKIYPAAVEIEDGIVVAITPLQERFTRFILPGFIDSHVHIESSMLIPSEFARLAVVHGTVATVSDPHEIANVLGVEGIDYMLASAAKTPFKFFFGAPSCVPATPFETAGAALDAEATRALLQRPDIHYLSEMMNFPGVLDGEPQVMAKIKAAQEAGKPVDGHAPGLRGEPLARYISAGITTDHESFSYEEGREKLQRGMKLLLREGSAAKNFAVLNPLLDEFPNACMLCTDDCHPNDLQKGHINTLVRRAVAHGRDLFTVLRAACITPVEHYGLDVGLLRIGEAADCIVVDSLTDFRVPTTYLNGVVVAENGVSMLASQGEPVINNFQAGPLAAEAFVVKADSAPIRVIKAIENEIFTQEVDELPTLKDGQAVADSSRDLLKIAVINRYRAAEPSVDFIEGFGLKEGAIASSVAHDSHNIIVVGCDDASMAQAVNLLIASKGGIAAVTHTQAEHLPLPVAGIMSNADAYEVARRYETVNRFARERLGSPLTAPFMTLSFMALLVIPELKLSDKGLFDSRRFAFTERFVKSS
jgi:adenine deaminase